MGSAEDGPADGGAKCTAVQTLFEQTFPEGHLEHGVPEA